MKQNWSRRELEAFGEPLGDSVTQRKLGGGYICGGGGKGGGGGGGAPPPASQTVTQTSIPEYARPYVETMLGKSEALTDINQNPYQPYGGQRIAGFNPTQEQVFQNIANQQVAGQVGAGTAMAGAAGLGSLGAGADYRNMATNPYATQAYMSPYMQNVVDVQKNEAFRDAQMRNIGANLGAARQGTYGGARQVLAEQERNRNLQQQMANIQATGTQNAFQAAQQAQQFGTTAGLQGYGQALQGASTLGQLGQTQFGQQQAINAAQQQVGAVQQAQAQQGLDLAYQDFLKQRNYPYQQLAFMSDMTRGIPLSQAAQQVYTAPPSTASQLGGLGMSALGIYGMSGGFKAKGGQIKEMAKGGLAYATGGDIKTMTTDQLEALLENPGLTPLEVDMVEKQLMVRRRMEMNPESDQIMAPALRSGIGSIATGEMVPEEMAGGGIIAFAGKDQSLVEDIDNKEYRAFLRKNITDRLKALDTQDPFKEAKAQEADIRAQLAERRRTAPYEALTMAGLGTLAGTSQNALSNLGLGAIEGMKTYGRAKADERLIQKDLLQQGVEREKTKYARDMQNLNALQTSLGQMDAREIAAMNQRTAQTGLAESRRTTAQINAQRTYDAAVKSEKDNLFKQNKAKFNMDYTDPELDAQAIANVNKRLTPAMKSLLFPEGMPTIEAPAPAPGTAAPGAAPAAAKSFTAIVDGKTFTFPSKEAADTFKKRAKELNPQATIR